MAKKMRAGLSDDMSADAPSGAMGGGGGLGGCQANRGKVCNL